MINGIHALVYAKEAGKARKFFRDVMGWPRVDAGHGWLTFALPPAEIAAHPAGDEGGEGAGGSCSQYLMCDDVEETVAELKARGVEVTRPISNQGWGMVTTIVVPGFGEMGLYQPKHPLAHGLRKASTAKKTRKRAKKRGKAAGRR